MAVLQGLPVECMIIMQVSFSVVVGCLSKSDRGHKDGSGVRLKQYVCSFCLDVDYSFVFDTLIQACVDVNITGTELVKRS